MSKLTREELVEVIRNVQENNPPESYLYTHWYLSLLAQLEESFDAERTNPQKEGVDDN